jgi:hypothetical protein
MTVRSIPATPTTPAHLVTSTRVGKVVYVNEVFKGSVEPMRTPGFYTVRDVARTVLPNPADVDGLWDNERDALDFLARM